MYKIIKRIIDIFIALFALTVLSPIFLTSVCVLLFSGERTVFYLQKRIGYQTKPFSIIKFATMLKDSPNMNGGLITVRNDPRVLPFGRILRITKINELPQIINVLIGDMSIVGPRPLVEKGFRQYTQDQQEKVYNMKPGITGIGSVVFRDEEKLLTSTDLSPKEFYRLHIQPYKGDLELWYQQNASLSVDFKIIFLTAWSILFPQNHLHQKWFKGLPELPQILKG